MTRPLGSHVAAAAENRVGWAASADPTHYELTLGATLYGIAVSSPDGLRLASRVARRATGIYYLIERHNVDFGIDAGQEWDPHASYHTDGWHHVKSFGKELFRTQRQPLGPDFTGAEPLSSQSFQPGEMTSLPAFAGSRSCADLFVIPGDQLDDNALYTLAVDIVAPDSGPLPGAWRAVVAEHVFRGELPWIHVTLGHGLAGVPLP